MNKHTQFLPLPYLTAAIAAMLVVGGFWLRNIKDASIKALQAAIQAKDAEIARLKGEAAPAIAKAYAEMRQHANQMTEDARRLAEELSRQEALQQVERTKQEKRKLVDLAEKQLDQNDGLTIASQLLRTPLNLVQEAHAQQEDPIIFVSKFVPSVLDAFGKITEAVETRNKKIREILAEMHAARAGAGPS